MDTQLARAGLLELAMEEAGRAVADAIYARWPGAGVLLLAGGGANGGDALVAARHLQALGQRVEVLALPSRHPLTRMNRRRLVACGMRVGRLTVRGLQRSQAEIWVDGLLGTGFRPPLRPELLTTIQAVQAGRVRGKKVVSIDLPSGLEADSAAAWPSVQADLTVTLSGYKPALLFAPACEGAGEIVPAPLRTPPAWLAQFAYAQQVTDTEIAALLPRRSASAHKGTAGRVWIVGGSAGMVGAPLLAGTAALRTGAGLVTLYSEAKLPLLTPELMIRQSDDLRLTLRQMRPKPDAVAVGMGLGNDAAQVAAEVLHWGLPTVIDADALQPELAGLGHAQCLWTPHPGEAARMLGVSVREITQQPLAAAQHLQQRFGGVVLLKGTPTVITGSGERFVNVGGHPGMASAGMGDTLSGMLAALLGQGLTPLAAAVAGARLHTRSGERAAARHGNGLMASDVGGEIGAAWLDLAGA